jgi:hypothetical protein
MAMMGSHGNGHLVEGNTVEEDLHVLNRVDGDSRFSDVADNPGVVGVIPAVRGEVERNGKSGLTSLQIAAVKGIGLFSGRESGVLSDRPGASGVHRGARTTDKRCHSRHRIDVAESLEILGRVQRLDRDAFGRIPGQLVERLIAALLLSERPPVS